MKKGFVLLLALALLGLAACGGEAAAETTGETTVCETAAATTVAVTGPEISVEVCYDDRILPQELGGSELEILEQQVESRKVGSEEPDEAVLLWNEDHFIAVGVGTAVVEVDGRPVGVRVLPAPISLFMITGHSAGSGLRGNGAQSVQCLPGQAYSCHEAASFQSATGDMGIGFAAAVRPAGIDAFMPGGGGTPGEAAALAWKWNQLTGEKVWVLNAAVSGTSIVQWRRGQEAFVEAVDMYRAAVNVLENEIAAGHYILKNTAVIYHSGANFGNKVMNLTDEVLQAWYDSMYNGFMEEGVQALALQPSSSALMSKKYTEDQPVNYYMALSEEYPGCFMATDTVRYWNKDELVKDFPDIEYITQSEAVEKPANAKALLAADGSHFTQVAYNAVGLGLAESLYAHFRRAPETVTFTVREPSGMAVETVKLSKVGKSIALVVEAVPYYASDLTIEVSGNLEVTAPFVVEGIAPGEGYIRIVKDGVVLHTIPVTVGE